MVVQPSTHVGQAVPDLDAAMASLGGALGLDWCEVLAWDMRVWTPEGAQDVHCRFTYSTGPRAHRFELLQSVPGTLWDADGPTAHHVGFWSSNLRGDGAGLEAEGFRLVGTLADDPGRPTGFAYYQHPDGGPLLELVDDALIPRFERWWAGERF